MNAQVIAVVNQKGGTGKSTTCANLGVGLAQAGKKVLVVDCDPKCRKKENAEELKRFWRNKHYAINSRHNKQQSHITHHLSQTMGYQKSKRPGGHPEAFAVIWANISISQRVCVTLHHQMYPKWEFHRLEYFSEWLSQWLYVSFLCQHTHRSEWFLPRRGRETRSE